MAAAVAFVEQVGSAVVAEHNARLVERLLAGLPEAVEITSPPRAAARGPFGCFRARNPEATHGLYQALGAAQISVSLREGSIRVAPHLFNTERDIDRVLEVLAGGHRR
jgi:selenocysteine lyase/cysteine desulfurase